MSANDAVRFMQNQTALQESRDMQDRIRESVENRTSRNVSGSLGKNDFLKLLAAQLRYQDPLQPTTDTDFAAQLASFSSLEQMMNMNETLNVMAGQQAFTLVGKYVSALVEMEDPLTNDLVLKNIEGLIDTVFTENGVTMAFIAGHNFPVPISSIVAIFDGNSLVTPDTLMQTSNNLIDRTVKAEWNGQQFEGVVTRITVDGGQMFARIEAEDGAASFVPVGAIYDIRQTGTPGDPRPVDPDDEEAADGCTGEGDCEIESVCGNENEIDP